MTQHSNASFGGQPWLTLILREATGIDEVKPEQHPERYDPQVRAEVAVTLHEAESTQRIALQARDEGLALYTWPAELKPQAKALYRTDRAQRLIDFLAQPFEAEAWQAEPRVHLGFWNSRSNQRLYLNCGLGITEYIQRWQGDDFGHISRYPRSRVREELWPWLLERQYAAPEDDERIDGFLERLGARRADLRATISLKRLWPWAHAAALDQDGALVSEVRAAVAEVLTVLDEPLPPGVYH